MGKYNPKGGATKLQQDIAADTAAAAETQQQQEELQANAAPLQEATGTADGAAETTTESQQAPEGETGTQEQPAPEVTEEKDIVIEPIAPVPPAAPVVEKAVVVEAAVPVSANASTNEQLVVILKDVPAANQIDINRIQAYL